MDLDTLDARQLALTSDFTPEALQAAYEVIEKHDHDLWKRCYPRNYVNYKPELYESPKTPARSMWCAAAKIEMGYAGDSEKYEIMWASQLAKYQTPQYWVAPDICDAIMHTTPPMEVAWHDMGLPHEAAAFLLPKGVLTHKKDGPVSFVSYARHRQGVELPSLARRGPETWTALNASFCVFSRTRAFLNHWNMPYDYFPTLNLQDIRSAVEQHASHVHSSGWLSTSSMDEDDSEIGIKTTHLIWGLMLFMLRKPELIDGGEAVRPWSPKGKAPRILWSPRVIGRNYKLRRVPHKLGGTHASPRHHWVEGFWRTQHYGPQNCYAKEILIDPYERGGGDEGEGE